MNRRLVRQPVAAPPGRARLRRRSARLFLAMALLALPLSACGSEHGSASDGATEKVTVKATALTAEQASAIEAAPTTGRDLDVAPVAAEDSAISVLINKDEGNPQPTGTTLISRSRSDGSLKWAVTITPQGASLEALRESQTPQKNLTDLLQSRTSGEIMVSPDGRRLSLILAPHHGELNGRLAEQQSYVVVLDAASGKPARTVELNGVILGQGLTNSALAIQTAYDYFPGGTGSGRIKVFPLDDPSAPSPDFNTDQWLVGAGTDSLLLSPQPPRPRAGATGTSTITQVDTSGEVRGTIDGVETVHPGGWVTQVGDPAAANALAKQDPMGKEEQDALDAARSKLARQVLNVSNGASVDVTGLRVSEEAAPSGPGLVISRAGSDANGKDASTPVFWLSAADDGHPHTENLEQFDDK